VGGSLTQAPSRLIDLPHNRVRAHGEAEALRLLRQGLPTA